MLHNRLYTYAYFFRILSTIKMKFGHMLVCCMTNISNIFLAQCFMILLKWKYSEIWPFQIATFTIFNCPIKNETLEYWHNWLLKNWSRLLNWKFFLWNKTAFYQKHCFWKAVRQSWILFQNHTISKVAGSIARFACFYNFLLKLNSWCESISYLSI